MKRLILSVTIIALVMLPPLAALDVQFFRGFGYVDEDEGINLLDSIDPAHNTTEFATFEQAGEFDPFTGFFTSTAASDDFWIGSLGAVTLIPDVIVIPELEVGSLITGGPLGPGLSEASKDGIKEFVLTQGKTLITAGGTNNIGFLNDIFGYSLEQINVEQDTIRNTDGLGNRFDSIDLQELPDGNAVIEVKTTSLPEEGTSIFQTEDGLNTSVFTIAAGAGEIIYLGHDWFSPNNDFISVLDVAIDAPPALSVTQDIDFGTVRIGTSATGDVTVSNVSDGTITGGVSTASGEFSGPGVDDQFSLATDEDETFTYTYTPTGRTNGTPDTQVIDIVNDTDPGADDDFTRNLVGEAVSAEFDSSIAPGSTINLNALPVETGELTLTLENINPDADLGDLTDLTIIDVQISGPDAGLFTTNFDSLTEAEKVLSGANGSSIDILNLLIAFNPLIDGSAQATLTITTDMNSAKGTVATGAFAGTGIFQYSLLGSTEAITNEAGVPEPTTLALLCLAILGLIGNRFNRNI